MIPTHRGLTACVLALALSSLMAGTACRSDGEEEADDELVTAASHGLATAPWLYRSETELPNYAAGLPIRPDRSIARNKAKVVYSIHLPEFSAADELAVRGEVQVSRCANVDITGAPRKASPPPAMRPRLMPSTRV